MKEIPVVYIKDKIFSGMGTASDIDVLVKRLQSSTIYIFDDDGLIKNQPNISLYRRLAGASDIWLDAGPRDVDDIVDEVFSGASRVVIRPELWQEIHLKDVIDITENELMAFYTLEKIQKGIPTDTIYNESQGIILYFDENVPILDYKTEYFLKEIAKTKPTYMLNGNMKKKEHWLSLGIEGVLIPIDLMDV